MAKGPRPADASGGVGESRGGRTCERWGRLPGRACKMAAAVGRGQWVAPAKGDMGPLGGGGWQPASLSFSAAVIQLHTLTEGGQHSTMPRGSKLGKVTEGERQAIPPNPVSRMTPPAPRGSGWAGPDGGLLTWKRREESPFLIPFFYRESGNSGSKSVGGLPKVSQLNSERTASNFLVPYSFQSN